MKRIHLKETESTNTWVKQNGADLPSPVMVTATRQTAGRGQRGNTWESEEGMNITMSMLWRPADFPARRQFAISEAVSLAVTDTLAEYGIEAHVKWPNDIYVGDRKICGILIEHEVAGMNISATIIGAGLNVNQRRFRSDAPNPVSMYQLLRRDSDIEEVLQHLADHLERRLEEAVASPDALHSEYMRLLWRGDGELYPFATPSGEMFMGRITAVDSMGMLSITDSVSAVRTFAFKEVSFLLPPIPQL